MKTRSTYNHKYLILRPHKVERCVLCDKILSRGGRTNKSGFCSSCGNDINGNCLGYLSRKIVHLKKRLIREGVGGEE